MSNLSTHTPDDTRELFRGRKIYCGLYGGTTKVITKFIPSNERIQRLGGGVVVTGGGQVHYIQLDKDTRSSSVPESIVRGVQWDILDDTMQENEIVALEGKAARMELAQLKASEIRLAHTNKVREQGLQILKENQPAWAKAAIIASFRKDESDLYSDYYGSTTEKEIIIGWSKHTRDLFPEMRKAAKASGLEQLQQLAIPPTVDRNNDEKTENNKSWWHPADEHREKYSMGGGYYLKNGSRHSDGWHIRKAVIYDETSLASIAGQPGGYAVKKTTATPRKTAKKQSPKQAPTAAAMENNTQTFFRLNPEKNGVELVFPGKPNAVIRTALKNARWRWHRKNKCWYNNDNEQNRVFAARFGKEQ